MPSNTRVAKRMIAYAKERKLDYQNPKTKKPICSTVNPAWGGGKRKLAWRVSAHAFGEKNASAQKTARLCSLLFPLTPAQKLRERIVAGYRSILGAVEGGAIQRKIAKWCGLSRFEPWCAETWWYVLKELAGFNGPAPDNPYFVPSVELWAQKHGIIVPFRKGLAGMSITFVWDGKRKIGTGDHIGTLVKRTLLKAHILINPRTSEGNASSPKGDAVIITTRYWWQVNCIFDPAKLQKVA
jgi:hypothetical protein